MLNKDNYRYLQDYGLGPATPKPVLKSMELGPRDRLSQAFWQGVEEGPHGADQMGRHRLARHAPSRREADQRAAAAGARSSISAYAADPVTDLVPVRPGGALHDGRHPYRHQRGDADRRTLRGGRVRLRQHQRRQPAGIQLAGRVAGVRRACRPLRRGAREDGQGAHDGVITSQAADAERIKALFKRTGGQAVATLKREMNHALEEGCGIYRDEKSLEETCKVIADVHPDHRWRSRTRAPVFNTDLYQTPELGAMIQCAETVALSALARKESRGAHQRLDYEKRDDTNCLKHSMAHYNPNGDPRIDYLDVVITKSQPAERVYGAAARWRQHESAQFS